jgi:nucleotide-binding universal stress UspA family protein
LGLKTASEFSTPIERSFNHLTIGYPKDVDMVIIESCGNTRDMSQIFFGSTAEKVLRFITPPVLCIPPESEYRTGR